jgi:hypothetical protein
LPSEPELLQARPSHLVRAIVPALQSIQVTNITTISPHPIPHVVVAVAVVAVAVVAVATRADKKVVEVIMTITIIIVAIKIRRSTRTLLTISVTIFLLTISAVTSLVVLMTAKPMRMCVASSMTPNTAPGLKQFTPHLKQVVWPRNFKLKKLRKYDGKENPKSWVMLYEITVCSAACDEHVMANYLLVVLDQASHQWLLSLPENQFDSWSDLWLAFINNFIATCDQPSNKYDLERIRD